jgi:hypothetical protein
LRQTLDLARAKGTDCQRSPWRTAWYVRSVMQPRRLVLALASISTACAAVLADMSVAEACGCLSPPLPDGVGEEEFAVNQSAEQIIFETEPGWVTAHVLIKYAGDPDKFAWIVPVPEVPELAISPASAFGLIDRLTAPVVTITPENICPVSEWSCRYHEAAECGGLLGGGDDSGDSAPGLADAGASGGDPVDIINEQVVGDYQTVTFRASEASAAVQWLRDNGFIVNSTTSIYMESYIQANMVFVAAKLIPGAGVKAIKPLRLRYRAAYPMVPLVLTAVAADPHLTVTSFIYGNQPFAPLGHPVVSIDHERIATDAAGRANYPMVLSRTIDEAGRDAFAVEYRGYSVRPEFGQPSFCCDSGFDTCGIGGNAQCECPRDEFDRNDCSTLGDLVDGVTLVDDLLARHTHLTRITTRVSPEEMTFDPQFEPKPSADLFGRLTLAARQPTLAGCKPSVIDRAKLAEVEAMQGCAATYCGPGNQCVATAAGAACLCGADQVAQRFVDLDGLPSVTCVPRVPTCDLRAGGEQLPDACATTSCGSGSCIDRNGIAVCACDAGHAAIAGTGNAPRCVAFDRTSATPGAEDFSEPLRDLEVCAPPPPKCGEDGWLVRKPSARPGVNCGFTDPPEHLTIAPPKPTCGFFGCGGCQADTPAAAPVASIGGAWIVLGLLIRRRRRQRR